MKLRTTSRAIIAGTAIAAALTMTACSSDDSGGDSKTTSTAAASAAASTTRDASLPPVPTVEDLNNELQRALDPNVPTAEKAEYIQGTEADPELVNRLADAYKQSGVTITITDVQDTGDQVQANGTFTVNGQANPGTVPFIAENGKWKVEKTWTCQALQLANIQSPACA